MILVTGGTGLVGAHLLLQLVMKHDSVRAIHRKQSDLNRVLKVFGYYQDYASALFNKIEWIEADINDIPTLEKAFEAVTHVYHAAALISFDPGDYENLMKINAEGTANIVNLCTYYNIAKLCYVSTIGTIGKSLNNKSATEDNEWNDHNINVYARSKYAAEMEVWRASQEGLSVVMVNPGVVLGPGFWQTGSGALFKTANKGYSFYPPGGTGFVSVHDVVYSMIALMESSISSERYITVAQNISFEKILEMMAPLLGKKPPTKKLTYWQLEVGRIVDIVINLFTSRGRKITKKSIHSLKHQDAYSSEKIKKALNFEFEPLTPVITFSCERFIEENH